MMAVTNVNIEKLLTTFFKEKSCDVTKESKGIITVQLTEEMDKKLMNRPFYWQYVQSTGNKGVPMKLTFITEREKNKETGEWIHFGSPRLHQIINEIKRSGKYTQLFQQINTKQTMMLFPWLVLNIKISYQGQLLQEEVFSIGLQLINGSIYFNMMEQLRKIELSSTIANYCYTISPIIKLQSGFLRIEQLIDQYIQSKKHQWAIDSLQSMYEEIDMVNHFYKEEDDKPFKNKEIANIKKRLSPKIIYEVINGGIFYLTEAFEIDLLRNV